MNRPMRYGQIRGRVINIESNIGASEVFKDLSGHFMYPDGIGNYQIATAAIVSIVGWMTHAAATIGATEGTAGGESAPLNVAKDAVYLMPACGADGVATTEALLKAAVGETRDIYMYDTNIQCCNIGAGAVGILLVVGYEYYGSAVQMQAAKVMINWEKVVNQAI